MKRQHKYQSESEILKKIDAAHRKLKKLSMAAQAHLDMEELTRGADLKECREHKEEADALLGKIKRLRETRLPKLQNLLAEFRTIPLGEVGNVAGLNEQQVVLRSKA